MLNQLSLRRFAREFAYLLTTVILARHSRIARREFVLLVSMDRLLRRSLFRYSQLGPLFVIRSRRRYHDFDDAMNEGRGTDTGCSAVAPVDQ
mgnify:CR=1 FL=1